MSRRDPREMRVWAVAALAALGCFGASIVVVGAITPRGTLPWWAFVNAVPGGDKIGHVVLAAAFCCLANLAWPQRWVGSRRRWLTWPTLVLLAGMTAEEASQGLLQARTMDKWDLLANVAGLAAGQLLATIKRRTGS